MREESIRVIAHVEEVLDRIRILQDRFQGLLSGGRGSGESVFAECGDVDQDGAAGEGLVDLKDGDGAVAAELDAFEVDVEGEWVGRHGEEVVDEISEASLGVDHLPFGGGGGILVPAAGVCLLDKMSCSLVAAMFVLGICGCQKECDARLAWRWRLYLRASKDSVMELVEA